MALVAPALIMSLPLVFIHTTQGYMDLPSAIYTALAVIAFYQWIHTDGTRDDLMLGIAFLSIVSYIKNDGFVVYMAGTLLALVGYLVIFRKQMTEKIATFKKLPTWVGIAAIVLFFIVPFTFIKSYYNLGFNQAAGLSSDIGITASLHWEIFPVLWKTIWSLNNFSIAPVILLVTIIMAITWRKRLAKETWFALLAPLVIMAIFIFVFLVTENYKFVLDQTTSNRVFTMVFVVFFSSLALVLDDTMGKKHLA